MRGPFRRSVAGRRSAPRRFAPIALLTALLMGPAALPPSGPASIPALLVPHSRLSPDAAASAAPSLAAVPPAAPAGNWTDGANLMRNVPAQSQPTHATWDRRDNYLYVTNFGAVFAGGNTVTIIAVGNGTVVATVPVGDDPLDGAYDPVTGLVYILNYGTSCNITVFNGTHVVATIAAGCTPFSAVYDAADGFVYVTNSGISNVSVLNGTSLQAPVATGLYPVVPAYDERHGWVYVPNSGSDNVSVINGTRVIATVPVGTNPQSAIYDPVNGLVYVPNFASNNVTVINGTTVVANLTVGAGPTYGTVDTIRGLVYVSEQGSNSITILNGTHVVANLSVPSYPRNEVFDAADGQVYVPSWNSGTVSVINGSSVVAEVTVGLNPFSATYVPSVESVFVCVFNANNVTQLGTPNGSYPVRFHESGLPAGVTWSVGVGATNFLGTAPDLTAPEPNGSYAYRVGASPGYRGQPANGTLTVGGGAVQRNVTFVRSFAISFEETGLRPGTLWSVAIGSDQNESRNGSVVLSEPNGSYSYFVGAIPGYSVNATGSVNVTGGPVVVGVDFATVTYRVTFRENGYQGGVPWNVTLGNRSAGSSGRTLEFQEPNGSYSFAVAPNPAFRESPRTGGVGVNGTDLSLNLTFVPIFPILFVETGLPNGTRWAVTLDGTANGSTGLEVGFTEPNGSHRFNVSGIPAGYVANLTGGTVDVAGSPAVIEVRFSSSAPASQYFVVFVADGVPPGVRWTVTLGAQQNDSAGRTIGFWASNGSYAFGASAPGLVASPSTGTVVVNGSASVAAPISITFRASGGSGGTTFLLAFVETGLPPGYAWTLSLDSVTNRSVTGRMLFEATAGSHDYRVGPTPGYATNRTGSVTVTGTGQSVVVRFVPFAYGVRFAETGLSPGTRWGISVGAQTVLSSDPELVVPTPNGSSVFTAEPVAGFLTPSGGSFLVNGSDVGPIAVPYALAPQASSSAGGFSGWALPALGAGGVAAAILVVALLRRRRGRAAATEPGEPAEGEGDAEWPEGPEPPS